MSIFPYISPAIYLFCVSVCCPVVSVALPILFYKLQILGLYLSVPLYIIMCKWFKRKVVYTLVMNWVKERKRAVSILEVRSGVWLLVGNKKDLPCCSATISIRWQVQSIGNSTMVRYKQKQKKAPNDKIKWCFLTNVLFVIPLGFEPKTHSLRRLLL